MGYTHPSYRAYKIMRSKDPSSLRMISLWKFKSTKSNKWYIVEVEEFPHDFYGLKFYYKGVANSKRRYSLLTYDFEPRTIVMSCINIMRNYYDENPCASFGFVAADDIDTFETKNVHTPNKRFRFYRRMMLTLFSPVNFEQYTDTANSIYLLINKKTLKRGEISLSTIERELTDLYIGDYNLNIAH